MAHNHPVATSGRSSDDSTDREAAPWGIPGVAELSNPVLVLDREGRVCSWNLAVEKLTRVPAEQILGEPLPDRLLSAEYREAARATIARAISGEHAGPVELRFVTSDGEECAFVGWSTHARAHSGEITATALVGIDATGLLAAAGWQGGVESRIFSHFSHGVAHRFNNTLMVIHGNLQLVQSFKSEQLDEDTLAIVGDALAAAEDGAELVRGLLGVSPRERRAPQVLDLESIVREFAGIVRSGLPEHTEFTVSIEADVRVEIEFAQFKAALLHLVVNARESMPSGGVLSLAVEIARVSGASCRELGGIAPGRYALVTVEDSGHGITPADVHKVREPFFTTKSKSRSLGLGLTFVDDFARTARGGLAIESRLGVGTRAVLALPVINHQSPPTVRSKRRCAKNPCE